MYFSSSASTVTGTLTSPLPNRPRLREFNLTSVQGHDIMKPEEWWLDLYKDLFSFAPFNSDLARAFVAIDHDVIPDEDARGFRRVESWTLTFEGVVRKGQSIPSKSEAGFSKMASAKGALT